MRHMETVRLTTSQACIRFLENQYVSYIDMDGKEVIIRTLDIGADKQIGYFNRATATALATATVLSRKSRTWKYIRARTSRAWLWQLLHSLVSCAASRHLSALLL